MAEHDWFSNDFQLGEFCVRCKATREAFEDGLVGPECPMPEAPSQLTYREERIWRITREIARGSR